MNDQKLETRTRRFIQERIDAGDTPSEIRSKCYDEGFEGHLVEKIIDRKLSEFPREF